VSSSGPTAAARSAAAGGSAWPRSPREASWTGKQADLVRRPRSRSRISVTASCTFRRAVHAAYRRAPEPLPDRRGAGLACGMRRAQSCSLSASTSDAPSRMSRTCCTRGRAGTRIDKSRFNLSGTGASLVTACASCPQGTRPGASSETNLHLSFLRRALRSVRSLVQRAELRGERHGFTCHFHMIPGPPPAGGSSTPRRTPARRSA
jgi:hypothetical protein